MGLQNEDWGSALRASGPLAEAHGIVLRGASDAISRYSREEGHLGIRDRGGIHQRLLWPIAEGPVVNNIERSAVEKKSFAKFPTPHSSRNSFPSPISSGDFRQCASSAMSECLCPVAQTSEAYVAECKPTSSLCLSPGNAG